MKKPSVPLFKGKNKTQVTLEAFEKLGVDATRDQVNAYAKKEYGIDKPIESSMYYTQKTQARILREKQNTPPRNAVDAARRKLNIMPVPQKNVFSLIRQVQKLANEVGGAEKLRELVDLVQNSEVNKLLDFAENYK